MKLRWIDEHQDVFPVRAMCQVLGVGKTCFYEWKTKPSSPGSDRRQRITEAVHRSFEASHQIYGYRKVFQDLREWNIACCPETVRRVMKENGWFSKVKRVSRRASTTNSKHNDPIAPNILDRDFTATKPNKKWVTDITYVATDEGWLYLAAVEDLFSRRIVGWAASDTLMTSLVADALRDAIGKRLPGGGLLHHSDRGSQYASLEYRNLLEVNELSASMSRKANCWDNAPMESFFGSLKSEWLNFEIFDTREQARASIFEYIEVFYNRRRRHESLDYVSPMEFEHQYHSTPR